jgi:hypothetical protein
VVRVWIGEVVGAPVEGPLVDRYIGLVHQSEISILSG